MFPNDPGAALVGGLVHRADRIAMATTTSHSVRMNAATAWPRFRPLTKF
jgi:hypothetical protein